MLGIALMLAASAAQPVAAEDPASFDIRCLVASQAASESPDASAEQKAALGQLTMYFMGRVDAGVPAASLEGGLEREGATLEGTVLGPLLQRCGEFLQVRGKIWMDMGTRIEGRERVRRVN